MTFNDSELMDALLAAMEPLANGEEGVTAGELAAAMGVSEITARKRLRGMLAAGTVEHVAVRRRRINGVWAMTDGYRPTEAR